MFDISIKGGVSSLWSWVVFIYCEPFCVDISNHVIGMYYPISVRRKEHLTAQVPNGRLRNCRLVFAECDRRASTPLLLSLSLGQLVLDWCSSSTTGECVEGKVAE